MVNRGTLVVHDGTGTIAGAFTAAAGSTMNLSVDDAGGANTTLTVATGFTNDGAIALNNASTTGLANTVVVSAGTLTNAAGATVTDAGAAGQMHADQIEAYTVKRRHDQRNGPSGVDFLRWQLVRHRQHRHDKRDRRRADSGR